MMSKWFQLGAAVVILIIIIIVVEYEKKCQSRNNKAKRHEEDDSTQENENGLTSEEDGSIHNTRSNGFVSFISEWLNKPMFYVCLILLIVDVFLFSNWVITYAEEKGFVVESVLQYDSVLALVPTFLSLIIAIIIAVVQIKIQYFLQEANTKKDNIQKEHNQKLRNIDLKAHKSELMSKSIKRDFYFQDKFQLGFDDPTTLFLRLYLIDDNVSQYFSVDFNKVTIWIQNEKIEFEKQNNKNEIDMTFVKKEICLRLKKGENLDDKIVYLIENALVGKFQDVRFDFAVKIIDNSFGFSYEEENESKENINNSIELGISAQACSTREISKNKGIYMDSNWSICVK